MGQFNYMLCWCQNQSCHLGFKHVVKVIIKVLLLRLHWQVCKSPGLASDQILGCNYELDAVSCLAGC